MDTIGSLYKEGERFAFSYAPLGLTVRGQFAEWVLEAAAEVIAEAEKHQADSNLEELETLVEFEEASDIDLDIAKSDHKAQFEAVPQCVVTLAESDFRWVSAVGRHTNSKPLSRIQDMSLTRNDSFLQDEAV